MNEAIAQSVVEAFQKDVHGLSEQRLTDWICDVIQSCEGLHAIIYGLDECDRSVQQAIRKTLDRLLSVGHPVVVKVLFTCRDEGYLMTGLNNFGRLHVFTHASAADMQSYISHAIASSLLSGQLSLRSRTLKDEIIHKLTDKAQGMYVSHDPSGLAERRSLKLLGSSGYISRSLICVKQRLMKIYAKSSSICRKDCTTHTRASS